jgi:hypothetical protein
MKIRTILACAAAAGIPLSAAAPAAFAGPVHHATAATSAPAAQDQKITQCSAAYYTDGDKRTGPKDLPNDNSIIGQELAGYQRWGTSNGKPLDETQFFAMYWTGDQKSGNWKKPKNDGFAVGADEKPIEYRVTLPVGDIIDRYGAANGSYLSPFGTPYANRSISPRNLDTPEGATANCSYYEYQVVKAFPVEAGPVAPWYGQPGYSTQYVLSESFGTPGKSTDDLLKNNEYLTQLYPPTQAALRPGTAR